jgi:hypothetical protein
VRRRLRAPVVAALLLPVPREGGRALAGGLRPTAHYASLAQAYLVDGPMQGHTGLLGGPMQGHAGLLGLPPASGRGSPRPPAEPWPEQTLRLGVGGQGPGARRIRPACSRPAPPAWGLGHLATQREAWLQAVRMAELLASAAPSPNAYCQWGETAEAALCQFGALPRVERCGFIEWSKLLWRGLNQTMAGLGRFPVDQAQQVTWTAHQATALLHCLAALATQPHQHLACCAAAC